MAKKVTIKEQFVEVAEVLRGVGRDDLAEFIDGRVKVLDNKTANKKETAKQAENKELKAKILEFLSASDEAFTVGELIKEFDVTSQKMSALLRQMKEDGAVERTVEKKVARFKAV